MVCWVFCWAVLVGNEQQQQRYARPVTLYGRQASNNGSLLQVSLPLPCNFKYYSDSADTTTNNNEWHRAQVDIWVCRDENWRTWCMHECLQCGSAPPWLVWLKWSRQRDRHFFSLGVLSLLFLPKAFIQTLHFSVLQVLVELWALLSLGTTQLENDCTPKNKMGYSAPGAVSSHLSPLNYSPKAQYPSSWWRLIL